MAIIKDELVALAETVKGSTGLDADSIAEAISLIAENYGASKQAETQAAGTAAGADDDKVKLTDFNALLTKLKAAGLMASS